MAKVATRANSTSVLPESLLAELERRRAGLARHMARAVVAVVRWDDSTGAPPEASAIARACEAGLDLFLATAREARPATAKELREVAQLGILQARGTSSVEPVLAAYRIAARVAWDAILRAWRGHPEATPEALVVTANYVFTALDQVAAEVTRTYLLAREQHLMRGTRARARLFHALISDTFESELALQKQALALNQVMAQGYLALVLKLVSGKGESERGAQSLAELLQAVGLPPLALAHAPDPTTQVILWPAEAEADAEGARGLVQRLQEEADTRWGKGRTRIRAGLGGFHPGLRGASRSYLEAQQAVELGRKLRPEGGLNQHDEVVPYLVLTQNPLLADRFVRHELGPLLDPDLRGQRLLLETLESFLDRGSVKAAASALHLHRHTVIYRLGKLKELLRADLEDPAQRLRLQLALDLRKLL
ncbi:MAG TPA: helix-turn-helix domain-containing protein [Candidatus Acidoferrales bacterium]|nr:helix-turn-helix domain-containing protein [Candidatus Acidoferrales bacterium]